MENNWSKYFMYNDSVDQYWQTASTIFTILEQPGMFMLEAGITDEDLLDEKECIHKLINWLKQGA